MKKVTVVFENFENLSKSQGDRLVGGFSASFNAPSFQSVFSGADNNCKGGNCVPACGGNSACNTVDGCGNVPPKPQMI
jgi:hypothetical protein